MRKKTNGLRSAAGIVCAVLSCLTLLLVLFAANVSPSAITVPAEAAAVIEEFLTDVRGGDYTGARACLYGTPATGEIPETSAECAEVWREFQESISYTLPASAVVESTSVAVTVTVSCLPTDAILTAREQGTECGPAAASLVFHLTKQGNTWKIIPEQDILNFMAGQVSI